jgi:hypothetical protein
MKHLPDLPESFQIKHHRFDIFGYCAACSLNLLTEPSQRERDQGDDQRRGGQV